MRKGIMVGATEAADGSIEGLVQAAGKLENLGFDDLWMANIFGLDAISTLSLLGQATKKVHLGTAVTPTYPRHPVAMAQQALTAGAASQGRFTLGIGLSHRMVIEDMFGLSYARPARHMREYLSALMPLMRGEACSFKGELYQIENVQFQVPGAKKVPVMVAALGEQMLKLAGEMADGTITWMTGPKTLTNHIVPKISAAAEAAGRPAPAVTAGFPVVLTTRVDAARENINKALQIYGMLPSYRSMLDMEGVAGPADVALVGDENALLSEMQRLKNLGVTHFNAAIVDVEQGAYDRTLKFLAAQL